MPFEYLVCLSQDENVWRCDIDIDPLDRYRFILPLCGGDSAETRI